MSVLSTTAKGAVGIKTAKAVKDSGLLQRGANAALPLTKASYDIAKPLLKRRMRRRAERLSEAARTIGEVIATYGPETVYELGLVDPPKPKRTAPRVVAGIVIGAAGMYLLEPGSGREHREKLASLLG